MRVLMRMCQQRWRQVQPRWWDGECVAAAAVLGSGLLFLWLLTI